MRLGVFTSLGYIVTRGDPSTPVPVPRNQEWYVVETHAYSSREVLAGELRPGSVSVDDAADLLVIIEYIAARLRHWNARTHELRSMSSTRSTSACKRASSA